MMKNIISALLLFITTIVNAQELQPVHHVNLDQYAGTWYEIASFPQRFQKNCEYTTAKYTVTTKGYMLVENRCMKNKKPFYIKGKAFSKKNSGNAKLKIQFLWPFRAKY
jgi:apolipoprotein D and lipocalin family protein